MCLIQSQAYVNFAKIAITIRTANALPALILTVQNAHRMSALPAKTNTS